MYQVKNVKLMKNIMSNIQNEKHEELLNKIIFEDGESIYITEENLEILNAIKMIDKLIEDEPLYEEDLYYYLKKYYTSIVRGKGMDTTIYTDLIINLMGLSEGYNIDSLIIKGGGR